MATAAATPSSSPISPSMGEPGQRRLAVLLDLENLLYPAYDHGPEAIVAQFGRVIGVIDGLGLAVQIVGACNKALARMLLAHPHICRLRLCVHSGGPGAADRLLVDRADEIPGSAEMVVIGSGDGGFAMTARRLAQQRAVVVLGPPTATSATLLRVAHRFIPLRHPTGSTGLTPRRGRLDTEGSSFRVERTRSAILPS